MSKAIGGIDPGLRGGIAVIHGDELLYEELPIKAGEVDVHELKCILDNFFTARMYYLEDVSPQPFQKMKAYKTVCSNFGMIKATLELMGIPYQLVLPNQWTKVIHAGMDKDLKPKAKSERVFKRLFPKVKTDHDGIVDSLLIAEFGRRQLGV